MDKGKYLIVNLGLAGEIPILFPAHVNHGDILDALHKSMRTELVAAGRFEVMGKPNKKDKNDIEIWAGGTTNLDKKSRGEDDAKLIKRILRKEW